MPVSSGGDFALPASVRNRIVKIERLKRLIRKSKQPPTGLRVGILFKKRFTILGCVYHDLLLDAATQQLNI